MRLPLLTLSFSLPLPSLPLFTHSSVYHIHPIFSSPPPFLHLRGPLLPLLPIAPFFSTHTVKSPTHLEPRPALHISYTLLLTRRSSSRPRFIFVISFRPNFGSNPPKRSHTPRLKVNATCKKLWVKTSRKGAHIDEARGKAPGKKKESEGWIPFLRSYDVPGLFFTFFSNPSLTPFMFAELASLASFGGDAFRHRLRTYMCNIQ